MKSFIKIRVNHCDQLIAIDQIRDVQAVDRYHPDENAIITLKDGTRITTDWINSVETIAKSIEQANR